MEYKDLPFVLIFFFSFFMYQTKDSFTHYYYALLYTMYTKK